MGESVDNSRLGGCQELSKALLWISPPWVEIVTLNIYPLSFNFCQITNPLGRNNTLSYNWSFVTCCELRLWESVSELLRKRKYWGCWEQKDVKIQGREKTSVRGKPPRKNYIHFIILPKFQDILSSFLIDLRAAASSSYHSNISV